MSAFDTHPNASHLAFPYYFDNNEGITFGTFYIIGPWKYKYDMAIYYGSMDTNDFIEGRCSRWDVNDYSVVVSSWFNKADAQTIRNNIKPGAVGELYEILGRKHYYDKTWDGSNTLKILPTPSSSEMGNSNLKNMRSETLIYVKNITEHPINNTEWIELKIDGMISGSVSL